MPGWSEHEILVCLINAVEHSGAKLDFVNIKYPPGRTASGFTQKFTALKKTLQPELDAINSGSPMPETSTNGTPKKATGGRKRKTTTGEDGEKTPKKRGRTKKNEAVEDEDEAKVKDEPEGEDIEEEM